MHTLEIVKSSFSHESQSKENKESIYVNKESKRNRQMKRDRESVFQIGGQNSGPLVFYDLLDVIDLQI